MRPLQVGTKAVVSVKGFELLNGISLAELLGQVGTVVLAESHRTDVQVQFSPELVTPMRSQGGGGGFRGREMERLEKQGIVLLHRQALEIEVEVAAAVSRKKSKWVEVWEKVPPGEKERLHAVVGRMDLQLMNAQPSDPRSYLIHAITDGNPLTTSHLGWEMTGQ
eukprot:Skav213439  [mRNA]  locus=scaffold837:81745:91639:+ [translate_table: standard]